MHEQNVMTNVEMYANEVRLIQRLEEHNGAVNSVTFHGNNLLASASGLVFINTIMKLVMQLYILFFFPF